MNRNKAAIKKVISVFLISCLYLSAYSQVLSNEVDKTYNFSPQLLTKKQMKEKVKPLDDFWNKVKSDTLKYLPALRIELASDRHKPFFYYDGSSLLLSLSNTKSDQKLAGEAIYNCDIQDIDRELYVRMLNGLAFEGIDITKSALKILTVPNFSFYLTVHVMNFDQADCLAYCLLPLDSHLYTDSLIGLFQTQDTPGQEAILFTLWLGYTCRGDQLIRHAITDPNLSKTIRDGAAIIDSMSHSSFPGTEHFEYSSTSEIMTTRTDALRRFSDEGLGDLVLSTMALRKKMNCDFVIQETGNDSQKPTIEHNALAKQIVALNEFKSEKSRVDSLNKTSDTKIKLSFSIIDESFIPGDDPKVIALCLVTEEKNRHEETIFTIKYDKVKQKIVSIEKY